jgi:hypothetical protein
MQTVSERLSQHVLSNYSKFVAGVTEVASVERDLQVDLHLRFSFLSIRGLLFLYCALHLAGLCCRVCSDTSAAG